jgi:transcriptional regulator with XRE-family HTH domain
MTPHSEGCGDFFRHRGKTSIKELRGMAKGKYERWLKPEGLTLIRGWARDGLSNEQIAHNMGISRSTLDDWCKKYSDISDTIKKGKEVADYEVENALYKRALGYSYEEIIKVPTGNGKMKLLKTVTREIPPDTTAQIFWLKNRKPDKWKNNPVITESEEYEDDGLLAALDKQMGEAEDDSWMIGETDEDG